MTTPTPNVMPGTAAASPAADASPVGEAAPPPVTPEVQAEAPKAIPPWERDGEQFDPARAWALIQNVKSELAEYRSRTEPIIEEREVFRRASQTENERLQEDLAAAAERETIWRSEAVRSKVEALASAKSFHDPEVALALLGDLSSYVDGSSIDTAKLNARLEQLATDKPFLVAAPQAAPGFTPNRAQSQSGAGGALPMDAQIKAAEDRGDFAASIALKQLRYQHQQQTRR